MPMKTLVTTKARTTISMPRLFLHVEGAALLVAALALYGYASFNWWTLALFLLAPDLTFILYAVNRRAGSVAYNLAHTTVIPLAMGLVSALTGHGPGLQVALIWLAHIGLDRAVGYGFKYTGQAKVTHMTRV